ncbi:MAG: hypothetical protein AB7O96_17165 [Pseudobdellovibrionaceae bacterium]
MFELMNQFQQSIATLHPAWQWWIKILGVMNLVFPIFFIKRKEARIAIGTILIQGTFMLLLFKLQGFTRLLGLAHFGWFGLIFYFCKRVKEYPNRTPFGFWIRAVIAVDATSLFIDATDVARYVLGI